LQLSNQSFVQEWEEKYNNLSRDYENQKRKMERQKNARYMDQARQGVSSMAVAQHSDSEQYDFTNQSSNSDSPRSARPSSVASFASLSHHAKSIASTFSCTGERELAERQKKNGGRTNGNSRIYHHGGDKSPTQSSQRISPQYSSRR
jgi:hypothetical protein